MDEDHLIDIVHIEQSCFKQPWTLDQYKALLQKSNFFILMVLRSDAVKGYISFFHLHEEAEIINIAVMPEERGAGLGMMLVQETLNICRQRKARKIFLEVRPSNEPALKIYRQLGFEEKARRKNYYPDNHEDALVMSLVLN